MSHLDEGTLHALLDGELNLAEVSEIQQHLGSCVACGSRLQEVKQVLAEADRLVGAMETPAASHRPRPEPRRNSPPPPPSSWQSREAAWNEPPVLLVMDPDDGVARRRWIRGLKWAAALAVVVGGGKLLSDSMGSKHPLLPERDLTYASPAVPPAVASPEETRRPESTLAFRSKVAAPGTVTPRPREPKPVAKKEPVAAARYSDTSTSLSDSTALAAADSPAADSQLAAAAEPARDTAAELALAAQSVDTSPRQDKGTGERDQAENEEAARTRRQDEVAIRGAAAAALAELDRERRRERANAATAALPPARSQPAAANDSTSAAPAAPAPRTLEQRSQVYLRIGLDEATKQLGGPAHVIEGMTPQFLGLVRGQLVPGADPRRPAVRVVYLDARGRMILLDQQRLEPGQSVAAAPGNLRWAVGDVMLYLRGEPSQEFLRTLQARVR